MKKIKIIKHYKNSIDEIKPIPQKIEENNIMLVNTNNKIVIVQNKEVEENIKGGAKPKIKYTQEQITKRKEDKKAYLRNYYLNVIKPKKIALIKAKEEFKKKKEQEQKKKEEQEQKLKEEQEKKLKEKQEQKLKEEQTALNEIENKITNFVNSNTREQTINIKDLQQKTTNQKIMKEVVDNLMNNKGEKYILSNTKGHYITLNETNYNKLLDAMDVEHIEGEPDSFWAYCNSTNGSSSMTIKKVGGYGNYKFGQRKGGYFKYLNNTNINLERYGIFTKYNDENYDNNCIYNALKLMGMEEEKLNDLNLMLKNRYMSLNDLEFICKKYDISLSVKYEYESGRTEKKILNKGAKIIYELGLLDEHYFILEMTEYTSYSIENYDILKNEENFNKIIFKKGDLYKKSNMRFIDSYDLIKILLNKKEKYLTEIKANLEVLGTKFYNKIDNFENLEYDNEYILKHNAIIPKNILKQDYLNVFFDIETTIKGIHQPYLVCSIDDNNKKLTYNIMKNGEHFIYLWLCNIKENTRLIAHNASYDYKFIYEYLTDIENEIMKGNNLIMVNAMFYNKYTNTKYKIQIINSLNLIPMKLRDFSKAFKLEEVKEVINYKFYTCENIENIYCSIDDYKKYMTADEQKIFLENLIKWNLYNNHKKDLNFDIIKYAENYCFIDCLLLKNGYNKFKKDIKETINLNLDNYLTLPSMANITLINNNCFEGCYNLSGIPQLFISKCIVGGRSISSKNKKYHIKDKIICLDANSLYSSAMKIINGFVKGVPKILKNENMNLEFLKKQDAYYIQIKINKVNNKLNMPLTNIINEDGTREYTNDMENKIMFVGHIYFEDLIKYQNIEYEIINGYYFNDGYNPIIKNVISSMYEKRLNLIKDNNPQELVYKLLMNSSYGRTILKPITTNTKIKTQKGGYEKYILRHFDEIQEIINISGGEDNEYSRYKIKLIKNIMEHKNAPHIGIDILDASKRIMNNVICLAETLNINIFYEDTDSLHLLEKDLSKLKDEYKKLYNQDLLGEDLGQFKSDFKDWTIDKKLINIHSKELIILGKKAYIDVLEGTHKETGEIYTKYHYRLKGINEPSIKEKCKELNIDELELYKKLYDGEAIEFNLSASGRQFKFNKDYTINTNENFKRIIQF